MGEGCDGDLSGEETEEEEAFRGKEVTHLEEKMKVTPGVGRWDLQSLYGGEWVMEFWNWAEGAGGTYCGRIGRGWQKLRPRKDDSGMEPCRGPWPMVVAGKALQMKWAA